MIFIYIFIKELSIEIEYTTLEQTGLRELVPILEKYFTVNKRINMLTG